MNRRQIALLLVPPVLLASTWWTFHIVTESVGLTPGYLIGFLFYWLIWCLALPLVLLGRREVMEAFGHFRFAEIRPSVSDGTLLLLPLVLGYGYAFPRAIPGASSIVVLVSAILALVNAPLEELLWRGTYLKIFPESWWFGFVYPTMGFGLWHLAPLSVIPNRAPGGSVSFVAVSVLLGLIWGWVAKRSQSILWTSVAHMLFDFSGLGGRLYFR
jgi:membrane protease YdiL (CAAX protease family)